MKFTLKLRWLITLIGVVLIIAFIFSNSFKNLEDSKKSSDSLTDFVISRIDIPRETAELYVRKTAHVIEFALLGIFIMCLRNYIVAKFGKDFIGFACFLVLAIAVADEHIQNFSGRTSLTGDIIIDFIGALTGFLTVWIITKIYYIIKRKKYKNKIEA